MDSLKDGYRAVVAGATGGIGAAFVQLLQSDARCGEVIGLSRSSSPAIDFTDENTLAAAAEIVGRNHGVIDLLIDATGWLHDEEYRPEKSLASVNAEQLARSFVNNASGPILLLKHFSRLFPDDDRCIFATLSARVGSIGDNALGGWYGYRASKAALNMLVRTAAIELRRTRPNNVCLALHPGTVETGLSAPFTRNRNLFTPESSAKKMLSVIDTVGPENSGTFLAYDGSEIEW
ncbi:MAG: SDR family NAD(P)-dependent oxidoreductase [Stappiaceae bacterium]